MTSAVRLGILLHNQVHFDTFLLMVISEADSTYFYNHYIIFIPLSI